MLDFASSFADRTTLAWMAVAGLAGTGFVILDHIVAPLRKRYYAWRIARRLARGEDAYFEELRSLEAYRHGDDEKEQRIPLPASAAAVGGFLAFMVWAWREGREKQFTFYTHFVVAVVALCALYRIVERRRTELALSPSPEEKEKADKELFREGCALVVALIYLTGGWLGH